MLPRPPESSSDVACCSPTPFIYLDDVVFVRASDGFPEPTAGIDVDNSDLRLHRPADFPGYRTTRDLELFPGSTWIFLNADLVPLTTGTNPEYDGPYADMPDLIALDEDDRLDMHDPDGSSRYYFIYPLPPTPLNE